MLAYDAVATYFLNVAISVRDQPVTGQQFRRHLAGIRNGNRVREHVAVAVRLGLAIDKVGRHVNFDAVLRILIHGRSAIVSNSPGPIIPLSS